MVDGDDDPGRLDERAAAIIRAELDRVLAFDAFRAAPQLSAFLSFIVGRTLEGRAGELKGYTIAVEGLGRPADFNPQLDPIVRVEAGRLRRALAQYYAGDGHGDALQISMPVGGYVPVFTWFGGKAGHGDEDGADEPPAPVRSRLWRWACPAIAALALGLLALVCWYLVPLRRPDLAASPKLPAMERPAAAQPEAVAPGLVRVAITVPYPPADPRLADLLRRFSELLVDAMARFDDLIMIKTPPFGATIADEVDYLFELDVQPGGGGETEGFGRLRSVRDGRIVWTTSSGRASFTALQDSELAEMARRTATRLSEPFGIIPADARQVPPSPAIRCILTAFDARRAEQPELYQAARDCLTRMVEQDPGFYPGWAHLAIVMLGEAGFDPDAPAVIPQGDVRAALDRSLSAALMAIRLAPSGARAYQAMMKVLLLRGATSAAIQMGSGAQARNPYDPEILADVGALYVRLGRPLEGMPLLERATTLSVARPLRYDFYAFLGAYLIGAEKIAESYEGMLAADTSELGLLGQALKASTEHDPQRQAKALAQLTAKSPSFGRNPRVFLERRGFAVPVIDKILAALAPKRP